MGRQAQARAKQVEGEAPSGFMPVEGATTPTGARRSPETAECDDADGCII